MSCSTRYIMFQEHCYIVAAIKWVSNRAFGVLLVPCWNLPLISGLELNCEDCAAARYLPNLCIPHPARSFTVDSSLNRKIYLAFLSTDLSTVLCTGQGPILSLLLLLLCLLLLPLHWTVDSDFFLYFTVLYCTVLHCTVHCTVPIWHFKS